MPVRPPKSLTRLAYKFLTKNSAVGTVTFDIEKFNRQAKLLAHNRVILALHGLNVRTSFYLP